MSFIGWLHSFVVDIAERIERLITDARKQVARQVDITEVITKYEVGHVIVSVVQEGQTIIRPEDILKNPLTPEFLGMKSEAVYSQSKLETAIIDKLQQYALFLPSKSVLQAKLKERKNE